MLLYTVLPRCPFCAKSFVPQLMALSELFWDCFSYTRAASPPPRGGLQPVPLTVGPEVYRAQACLRAGHLLTANDWRAVPSPQLSLGSVKSLLQLYYNSSPASVHFSFLHLLLRADPWEPPINFLSVNSCFRVPLSRESDRRQRERE